MTFEAERHHPVVAFALGVRAAVKEVAGVEPTFMTAEEKRHALLELSRAESQLAAMRLRVMAVADDIGLATGARDVAAWLAAETSTEYRPARSDQELAVRIDRRWHHVADALLAGDVSLAHARIIVHALEALPADLPADTVGKAEVALIEHAPGLRPGQLARVGRRVLELVAPEVAEHEEARRLRDQERRARARQRVGRRSLGDGLTRIHLDVLDSVADRLWTYLDAFASPRRQAASRPEMANADGVAAASPFERAPYGQRMAVAFAALLEHLDPARLPHHGGDATTVMVTIDLAALRADLATAGLIDGDLSSGPNLTADEARRLACTARIIPVVLGGTGEILDQGRAQRCFTAAQRRAMRVRDKRCRVEGCTIPATWCEAHHLESWALGGRTDLADGALFCAWHHHRAHDQAYDMQRLPTGDFRFYRRT
jgi:hypothetical protein